MNQKPEGREYLKRVWRLPKDQGAAIYLAALFKKALRQHGWPADTEVITEFHTERDYVVISYHSGNENASDDFWRAYEMTARNIITTHRIELDIGPRGYVQLMHEYVIHANFFKRVPYDKTRQKHGVRGHHSTTLCRT